MILRIGHGNVFAGNATLWKTLRVLRASGCDSWDIAEGYRAVRAFRLLTNYRTHVGATFAARDVPILVKREHAYVGESTHKVNDALPAFPRVGKERHINMAVYGWDDITVAHIGLHPVGGIRHLTGVDPSQPLVRAYARAVKATAQALDLCRDMGWYPVLGSDRQVRPGAPVRPWSLAPVLEAHGLRVVVEDGLDILAADKRLVPVAVRKYVPKQTGSDSHNFLTVDLKRR